MFGSVVSAFVYLILVIVFNYYNGNHIKESKLCDVFESNRENNLVQRAIRLGVVARGVVS